MSNITIKLDADLSGIYAKHGTRCNVPGSNILLSYAIVSRINIAPFPKK